MSVDDRVRMAEQIVDMTNYMSWHYRRVLAIRKVYELHHPPVESLERLYNFVEREFEKYVGIR